MTATPPGGIEVEAEELTFRLLPDWILDAAISDRAVRLWAVLATYDRGRRKTGWQVKRETLAARLRCSTDSIDRALKELQQIGALTTTRQTTSDGFRASSIYKLWRSAPHLDASQAEEIAPHPRGSRLRTGAATVSAPVRQLSGIDNSREGCSKEQPNSRRGEISSDEKSSLVSPNPVPDEAIQRVFSTWQSETNGRGELSPERRKLISEAIKREGVDACLDACKGIARSQWHVENGHIDLRFALKPANIDRFVALAQQNGPRWRGRVGVGYVDRSF